jgi:hypothetical protein
VTSPVGGMELRLCPGRDPRLHPADGVVGYPAGNGQAGTLRAVRSLAAGLTRQASWGVRCR